MLTIIFQYIQPTIAAPPFDLNVFFEQLLEMNAQMADAIQRAQHEFKEMKVNELKIRSIGVVDNTNGDEDQLENTTDATVDQINPQKDEINLSQMLSVDTVEETNPHPSQYGDNTENNEKSYVGQALDVIENQWVDWFGQQNQPGVEEGTSEGNTVEEGNLQDNVIDGTEKGNGDATEVIETESSDQRNVNNLESQPMDIDDDSDNIDSDNREHDGEHGQYLGEETFNKEEDKGWFENVIDTFLNLFD